MGGKSKFFPKARAQMHGETYYTLTATRRTFEEKVAIRNQAALSILISMLEEKVAIRNQAALMNLISIF